MKVASYGWNRRNFSSPKLNFFKGTDIKQNGGDREAYVQNVSQNDRSFVEVVQGNAVNSYGISEKVEENLYSMSLDYHLSNQFWLNRLMLGASLSLERFLQLRKHHDQVYWESLPEKERFQNGLTKEVGVDASVSCSPQVSRAKVCKRNRGLTMKQRKLKVWTARETKVKQVFKCDFLEHGAKVILVNGAMDKGKRMWVGKAKSRPISIVSGSVSGSEESRKVLFLNSQNVWGECSKRDVNLSTADSVLRKQFGGPVALDKGPVDGDGVLVALMRRKTMKDYKSVLTLANWSAEGGGVSSERSGRVEEMDQIVADVEKKGVDLTDSSASIFKKRGRPSSNVSNKHSMKTRSAKI
ncbi:hypothetical protein Ddye_006487 [Dipteronia dyeriana]|uniref:Uncharacterized protein n=1 Tax=Dipteronia dyeriana TaxID=168575 RepID=A0AAD9XI80_9ROSI|nr:hypothetical protein Ddye_006487 [Dipteronia dyeriana]